MRILTFLIILVITGCATVASSTHYTKGTQALERGDYEEAAELLAEAVRLDPNLSRNHNNLAAALFELDRIEDGWIHSRRAVLLDPRNQSAAENNRRYFFAIIEQMDIEIGSSDTEVIEALGEPDGSSVGSECRWLQYGVKALCFRDGVLTEVSDMKYR